MQAGPKWRCAVAAGAAGVALALAIAVPAGATTLRRAGLEALVADNHTVVVGEVLDAHSYWNADNTFILTDVRIEVADVLKGEAPAVMTVTVMGGAVGDLTTLIVGGPELFPGRSYVLFVGHADLPGAARANTVRDLAQGVFDLRAEGGVVRAVSQASEMPLVPDFFGQAEPPGGVRGLELASMVRTVRELANVRTQGEDLK